MTPAPKPESNAPYWRPVFNVAGMITVVVSIILVLFAWPVANASPSNVPIGIVANTAVAGQIERSMNARENGAFSFTSYTNRNEAIDAVQQREVYGAIVMTQKPTIYVATAASPSIAALLNTVALQLGYTLMDKSGIQTITVDVTDLAPYTPEDQRGLGLTAAALPLVVAGIAAAILATVRLRRPGQKFALVVIASLTTSFVMTAILHFWLRSLNGPFGGEMIAIMFGVMAVSSVIIGLQQWFRTPGLIIGIVLMFVLGSSLSGASMAPEFYPAWLGQFGQMLPPGAELTLLRRLSFFPESPTVAQWFTLMTWVVLGMFLMWSSRWRGAVVERFTSKSRQASA